MLRITRSRSGGTLRVRLEGNLAGPWVQEARAACDASAVALDLSEVRFVDAEGLAFLCEMQRAGSIARSSSFVAELLRSRHTS